MSLPAKSDVVVCGSLHLDIVVQAAKLPAMDETAVGTGWAFVSGGKGRNQAAQAAAAGARVAMIGRVGRDQFGDTLLASLDTAAVDRRHVSVDATAGSGMSVAIVDAAGDYGAVIVSGANLTTDPAAVADAIALLGGRVLVLQNEVPEPVNLAAARAARRLGATILLNAAPHRPTGAELLALVDVLVVNRVEAAQMAGRAVANAEDAGAVAKSLAGTGAAIVTLGGDGLVVAEADATPAFIAPEKIEVVSTHGAGDCFVGALAARLASGDALLPACRAASVAAARHVAGG